MGILAENKGPISASATSSGLAGRGALRAEALLWGSEARRFRI